MNKGESTERRREISKEAEENLEGGANTEEGVKKLEEENTGEEET